MIYEGGVKTAYFLPKALKSDGTIIYYVVRTDGEKYYVHLNAHTKRNVTNKKHLFIREDELKGNIFELYGKEV